MTRAARVASILGVPVAVFVGLFMVGWGRQNPSAAARNLPVPRAHAIAAHACRIAPAAHPRATTGSSVSYTAAMTTVRWISFIDCN
jgi:hypothetical protein